MNHGSHKTYYCPMAKTVYSYKYTKDKLHRTNAITWFYKKGVHCVNKLIPTSLCEFVSTTVVRILIMHGSRIIQYLQCSLFLKKYNYLFIYYYYHHHSKIHSFHYTVPCKASGSNELALASWLLKSCWQHCYLNIQYLNHHPFTLKLNTWNTPKNTSISMVIIILHVFMISSGDSGL
jgi:hypothetical protein